MNMKSLCLIIFLYVLMQLSGCATIFNNDVQAIYIDSQPLKKVDVIVKGTGNGDINAVLPTTVFTKPSSFRTLSVVVNDECFKPTTRYASKNVTPSYWFNLINMHGFYIDYFTGYMWDYDSNLTVQISPAKNTPDDCESTTQIVERQPVNIYVETKKANKPSFRQKWFPENIVGLNVLLARSLSSRVEQAISSGITVNYARRFGQENMINVAYRNYTHDSNCILSDCWRYEVEHKSWLVSFRQYLIPKSNFFGGLGAARISVSQSDVSYLYSSNDSFTARSDALTTMFFEMGWIARYKTYSFQFTGIIDFADIGLDGRDLSGISDQPVSSLSADVRKRNKMYDAATRLTGIEFGIGFMF